MAYAAGTPSDGRIAEIREIIEKNVQDTGVDLKKIHQEVSRIVPLDPVKTPEYRALIEKRDMTVKKKFPLSDQQLRKMFQPQAERLYPLYKIGDQVSITYLLHGKPFTVRGKFYRKNGNVFYIGSAKIAKYTIPDEMVSKLDAVKNNSSKNKYIAERISTYHKNRQAYADQLFKDEIMQVQGYLKIAQKWVSARDYIQIELKRAEDNNAKTQIKYGDRFAMQQNYTEAAKCYRKAAKLGNSDAQLYLGDYYRIGRGVKKDSQQELYWYRKAAEQGNKVAQFILGDYYRIGYGVEKDPKQTVYWWRKAAEQGFAKVQNLLGECYASGYGVGQDLRQAVYWRRKAAEQGNKDAQFNLGVCYERGDGVEQDFRQAVYWWHKAAEQGDAGAQYNLGVFYAKGQGVTADFKQTIYWWKKAGEQGHPDAQLNLGEFYSKGIGVEKNDYQAAYWWHKAALQGVPRAQFNLGMCYIGGKGVKADTKQAAEWIVKAARQGDEKALNVLKALGID